MKCIICGTAIYVNNRKICLSCMDDWKNMKSECYDLLELKLGKFSFQNQVQFKKEMKRLENLWRKDKGKYLTEIEILRSWKQPKSN